MAPEVPLEARYPEAATVFHCTFDASWDANFDEWPDNWTRRRGPGFPHYVGIKLDPQSSPEGAGCLRVDLDGGAAVAYSPPVEIDPQCGYVLEGYLKTEGLDRDRAYFSITLLDSERQRLETFNSEKIRQTSGWQKFRLGPISLEPRRRAAGDRRAARAVGIAGRSEGDGPVRRRLAGPAAPARPEHHGRPKLLRPGGSRRGLLRRVGPGRSRGEPPRDVAAGGRRGARVGPGRSGSSSRPHPTPPRARRSGSRRFPGRDSTGFGPRCEGRRGLVLEREVTVAVFDAPQTPVDGEFGWTLPRGDRPLPLPVLTRLIRQAGIHWVKYPLWYDPERGKEQIEELITLGEQLGQQRIELVGLLNEPPSPPDADDDVYRRPVPAAERFASDPTAWYPMVEPVISRLAARVRWWQLGDDQDASFVDCPNLAGKLGQVKAELDRIGRDVNLGIGWGWLDAPPGRCRPTAEDALAIPGPIGRPADGGRRVGHLSRRNRPVRRTPLGGRRAVAARRLRGRGPGGRPRAADDRREDPRGRRRLLSRSVRRPVRADQRRRHARRVAVHLADGGPDARRGGVSRQSRVARREPQPALRPRRRGRNGRLEPGADRRGPLPGRGRAADRSVRPRRAARPAGRSPGDTRGAAAELRHGH